MVNCESGSLSPFDDKLNFAPTPRFVCAGGMILSRRVRQNDYTGFLALGKWIVAVIIGNNFCNVRLNTCRFPWWAELGRA